MGNKNSSLPIPEEREYAFDTDASKERIPDPSESAEVYHIRLMLLPGTARVAFMNYLRKRSKIENLQIFREVDKLRQGKYADLDSSMHSAHHGKTFDPSPPESPHASKDLSTRRTLSQSWIQRCESPTSMGSGGGGGGSQYGGFGGFGGASPSPYGSGGNSIPFGNGGGSSIPFGSGGGSSIPFGNGGGSSIPFGFTGQLPSVHRQKSSHHGSSLEPPALERKDSVTSIGSGSERSGSLGRENSLNSAGFADSIAQLFTDGNTSVLGAFETVQNEIFILFALGSYPKFILADDFKEWRSMESLKALHYHIPVEHIVENGTERDVRKLLAVKRAALNSSKPLRVDSDEFHERILAHVDDERVSTILESATWMLTLLHCLSPLPIAITVLKVNKETTYTSGDRKAFPCIYANKRFVAMTGYTVTEMLGNTLHILEDKKQKKTSPQYDKMNELLAKGNDFDIVINHYKKDETFYKARVFFKPIQDSNQTYIFCYAIHYNITENGISANKIRPIQHLIAMLPNMIPVGSTMEGLINV